MLRPWATFSVSVAALCFPFQLSPTIIAWLLPPQCLISLTYSRVYKNRAVLRGLSLSWKAAPSQEPNMVLFDYL